MYRRFSRSFCRLCPKRDSNATEKMDGEADGDPQHRQHVQHYPLEIVDLPPEIILLVFTHLPAEYCVRNVARVCRLFRDLLKEPNWWRHRRKAKGLNVHEKEENHEDFDVCRLVVGCEREERRWKAVHIQKKYSILAHFGTVNAVRLFEDSTGGRRCISAGRDRQIRLWDLDRVMEDGGKIDQSSSSFIAGGEAGTASEGASGSSFRLHTDPRLSSTELISKNDRKELIHSADYAHAGWIWQATSPNAANDFYSCGWDCLVKRWKMSPTGFQETGQLNLGSAVVGLEWSDGCSDELVCSTFLKRVCVIDSRADMQVVQEHKLHSKAVIGVATRGHLLYSWSEDRSIVLADRRRMDTNLASVKVDKSYVTQMSVGATSLYAGTSKGDCIYMNPATLEIWRSFPVHTISPCAGTQQKDALLRGVVNTGSAVLALSKWGKFDVLSCGLTPRPLISSMDIAGEPSRMDCRQGEMVVGLGEGKLVFWPKPTRNEMDIVSTL